MTGRRILITGASKGIGLATARRLAGLGHIPIGMARSTPTEFPGEFIAVDLTDRAATQSALDAALAAGPIDGVLNNVGMIKAAVIGEIDLDDFDAVQDITVRSSIQTVQAALPGMVERGWGRIVNITSLVSLGGVPGRSAYATSKASHDLLTRM